VPVGRRRKNKAKNAQTRALQATLRHKFRDTGLLERALAHRSYCAEHPDTPPNERLEFLGDAVLGLVVTDYMFDEYPRVGRQQ
jgi:ribonuclease III